MSILGLGAGVTVLTILGLTIGVGLAFGLLSLLAGGSS